MHQNTFKQKFGIFLLFSCSENNIEHFFYGFLIALPSAIAIDDALNLFALWLHCDIAFSKLLQQQLFLLLNNIAKIKESQLMLMQ